MKLAWSALAVADRMAIFDHVAADSRAAAVAQDERIGLAIGRLAQFPRSGRAGRVRGTLELAIARTPYVAAYLIAEEGVLILRILHGARLWPDELA